MCLITVYISIFSTFYHFTIIRGANPQKGRFPPNTLYHIICQMSIPKHLFVLYYTNICLILYCLKSPTLHNLYIIISILCNFAQNTSFVQFYCFKLLFVSNLHNVVIPRLSRIFYFYYYVKL